MPTCHLPPAARRRARKLHLQRRYLTRVRRLMLNRWDCSAVQMLELFGVDCSPESLHIFALLERKQGKFSTGKAGVVGKPRPILDEDDLALF